MGGFIYVTFTIAMLPCLKLRRVVRRTFWSESIAPFLSSGWSIHKTCFNTCGNDSLLCTYSKSYSTAPFSRRSYVGSSTSSAQTSATRAKAITTSEEARNKIGQLDNQQTAELVWLSFSVRLGLTVHRVSRSRRGKGREMGYGNSVCF